MHLGQLQFEDGHLHRVWNASFTLPSPETLPGRYSLVWSSMWNVGVFAPGVNLNIVFDVDHSCIYLAVLI